jgi:hypothetical protein
MGYGREPRKGGRMNTATDKQVNALVDTVVAETMRLLAQPNSINLPEDVRLSMAVVMAYERVSLMGSEELDAIIEARMGENA